MIIKTLDINSIKPIISRFNLPKPNSHKGQNGRVLVIGGSKLFHAASIWAAEVASYFVDIVHYCSTKENEKVFLSLKSKFLNGIIVPQKELPFYVEEDDAILIGPGMVRKEKIVSSIQYPVCGIDDLLNIKDEADYTYYLTKYLIDNFPDKKFVFDAGALQMMDAEWLHKLQTKPIITPHLKEFETIFGVSIMRSSVKEKILCVKQTAKKYNSVIVLKAINDIISDGDDVYVIQGGNAGLTKGGTGDILAGLNLGLYSKNSPLVSAVISSYLLKSTAERLFKEKGYWYNISDIIKALPQQLKSQI
ncbi:MAG: Carbohydrate kinase, YjeF related protein [Candidatus Roizmanbacteria bacterium GW2011_GWA2_36_23]|uniref:ADP-dependent (S)-NAD(P)H-hydrate dehydratase n=1 Tax=Candidatus Roizmanbacteria bacterium GW2011_GWA2_36_23 TaxID=1618480 RepID=A0A0G0E9Q5_9BACT|nr:MAG: Carbohydrate kinase, YjeF related protein [Candidatus Roizmanbacteria bacterium GW2011_GWA2_36_23]